MTVVGVMVFALSMATPVSAGGAQTDKWPEPFESGTITNFDPFTIGLMDCDVLRRVELPDGSSKETMSCDLNGIYLLPADDGPPSLCVDPECGPPEKALRYEGGGCDTWMSDWSLLTTGDVVFAERAEVVVTPSGKVHATTWYGPDPLTPEVCEELGEE